MIGKLTGRFGGVAEGGAVIIEVGGVGYNVRAPLFAIELMKSSGEIVAFIHTAVRDDTIDLYGFPTEVELGFFKQLMSVSGIGPKSALNIMNVSDISSLKRAIAHGDAAALTKIFGLGKKTAERIVVELRDKVAIEVSEGGASARAFSESDAEVIEALMALGYRADESRAAVKETASGTEQRTSVAKKVSAALKYLGSSASISH